MPLTTSANWLAQRIEATENSQTYKNYLEVRDYVSRMIDRLGGLQPSNASSYWQEELAGFEYLFDTSPLTIDKLRHHCYHITGIHEYMYRSHHSHMAPPYESKLKELQALDTENLLVGESPKLGGFGFEIEGTLINKDTLKFYEILIGMNKAGVLAPFKKLNAERQVVLEIGAGWGGFAYQFKTLFPNTTYLIVDLPPTLLFSGTYLKTLFPEARFLLVEEDAPQLDADTLKSHDFILMPHTAWEKLQVEQLDLAVNMVSFQEMTTENVESYVGKLARLGCRQLYSLNRDVSPHNTQLSAVSEVIGKYYAVQQVPMLDIPYTTLQRRKKSAKKKSPSEQPKKVSFLKQLKQQFRPPKLPEGPSPEELARLKARQEEKERRTYRHLACTLSTQ